MDDIGNSMLGLHDGNATPTLRRGVNGPLKSFIYASLRECGINERGYSTSPSEAQRQAEDDNDRGTVRLCLHRVRCFHQRSCLGCDTGDIYTKCVMTQLCALVTFFALLTQGLTSCCISNANNCIGELP